ncbi:kinase-like domain-containing protein [Rhizophagus diaphanus]|nr:kinase-like domain-containing protein [Rhizophagus diaphanus] [Rhizophagus sp. MUCL 43196]
MKDLLEKYYDYQDLKNISKIDSGGSASVFVAYWKDTLTKYAIKTFDKDKTSMREIINEINIMIIASNPNIIRFFGITKLKDELSLVLEYADDGTLEKYLRDNATTLIKWETQLKFTNETAAAISCEEFTKPRGIIPYMDPKILDNNKSYDLTEKSDIYSLGIVFWELTSCLSPFGFEESLKKNDDTTEIVLGILDGKREDPIPNTNSKFVTLYKKCWKHEPDERPDIQQVISEPNNNDPIVPIDSENNNVSENINSIDESNATKESENEDSDLPDSPSCEGCDINIKFK